MRMFLWTLGTKTLKSLQFPTPKKKNLFLQFLNRLKVKNLLVQLELEPTLPSQLEVNLLQVQKVLKSKLLPVQRKKNLRLPKRIRVCLPAMKMMELPSMKICLEKEIVIPAFRMESMQLTSQLKSLMLLNTENLMTNQYTSKARQV